MRAPQPAGLWPPPPWEQRFRAGRVFLPEWATRRPERAVVIASASGVLQAHSWDSGTGRLVQATDRPGGTTRASIDPTGTWIWWFDDTAGNEFGGWRRQPFGSTPQRRPEHPVELAPAYDAGLLLAADGTAIIGRSDSRYGTQIHQVLVGAAGYGASAPVLLYAHTQNASVAALSRDANLVAISHSERGDSRHPAIRVVRGDTGTMVADLDDGAGLGLWAQEFAPIPGDTRLLVQHERTGAMQLLIWDVATSIQRPLDLGLSGDIASARWYPNGRALLVLVQHQARTLTYRYDLRDGSVHQVGPSTGSISAATPRPQDEVWLTRSSAADPPAVIAANSGRPLLQVGQRAPGSVPAQDVWAEGPGGQVHGLLRLPSGPGPHPAIVQVHGGPHSHDSDSFDPAAAAWVDHGFAVLKVNYRGSTGYGAPWRDALTGQVGFAELADIAAVHQSLVEGGVLDPDRSVLSGTSWGGYLTLLGLGTQPQRWTIGLARVPVADYVAAYEDEMEPLKAYDRALFGGSPDEVPETYRVASPMSYLDQVRAPVLIQAGTNDPRCPLRQIENYVSALQTQGKDVQLHTYDAGHGSYIDTERISQIRVELEFIHHHLPE